MELYCAVRFEMDWTEYIKQIKYTIGHLHVKKKYQPTFVWIYPRLIKFDSGLGKESLWKKNNPKLNIKLLNCILVGKNGTHCALDDHWKIWLILRIQSSIESLWSQYSFHWRLELVRFTSNYVAHSKWLTF